MYLFNSFLYSLTTDGRMENVVVYGLQKRYSPEKHYVFILEITRENVKSKINLWQIFAKFWFFYHFENNLVADCPIFSTQLFGNSMYFFEMKIKCSLHCFLFTNFQIPQYKKKIWGNSAYHNFLDSNLMDQ